MPNNSFLFKMALQKENKEKYHISGTEERKKINKRHPITETTNICLSLKL